MKGNTRKEILEAWDNGKKLFWFWDDFSIIYKDLGYIGNDFFETASGIVFDNCSIEDPRPKKKMRKMTLLEMAWLKGDKVVFRLNNKGDWWAGTILSEDETSTHYAEILDEGKRIGPWKPLEVEE